MVSNGQRNVLVRGMLMLLVVFHDCGTVLGIGSEGVTHA